MKLTTEDTEVHRDLEKTMRSLRHLVLTIALLLTVTLSAHAQVKIAIDHNANATATSAFKFKNVPSPVRDDLGARSKLTPIDGDIDPNGANLSALVDGVLPTDEDEPGANFFFNAGTAGGRFRMALGSAAEIGRASCRERV